MDRKFAEKFIKGFLDDIWTQHDVTKVSKYYHKNVTGHLGNNIVGYDEIIFRCECTKELYKEMINDVEEILCDKDKIILRLIQTGTNREDDYSESYYIIAIYQIVDEKIKEFWAISDKAQNYIET